MMSGPIVRKVHDDVAGKPVKSDSVAGGWWPRSRRLAAQPPSSERFAVRSDWTRATVLRSR